MQVMRFWQLEQKFMVNYVKIKWSWKRNQIFYVRSRWKCPSFRGGARGEDTMGVVSRFTFEKLCFTATKTKISSLNLFLKSGDNVNKRYLV